MTNTDIFEFNHTADTFYEALGFGRNIDTYCREVIYFSSITNHLLGKELFDNEDDTPSSLKTKTGDLEKSLTFVKNEEEKNYLLLVFHRAHEVALETIGKYCFLQQANDEEKMKFDIMMKMLELKIKEKAREEGEDDERDYETPSAMINRVEYVKEARYDFKRYLQLTAREVKNVRTMLDEQENC